VFRRTPVSAPPAAPPSVDELRESARREAYAEGFTQGRAEAVARARREATALMQTLDDAAAALTDRTARLADEIQQVLPAVVLLVTRKVLDRELADDAVVVALVRAVVARLQAQGMPVVLCLAPGAVALLDPSSTSSSSVRIEADPTLTGPDWTVETPEAFLDGRLDTQLDEALRHLEPPAA